MFLANKKERKRHKVINAFCFHKLSHSTFPASGFITFKTKFRKLREVCVCNNLLLLYVKYVYCSLFQRKMIKEALSLRSVIFVKLEEL